MEESKILNSGAVEAPPEMTVPYPKHSASATEDTTDAFNNYESPLQEAEDNAWLKPIKDGIRVPRKKLCGYLNKFGTKGPMKGWKYRWFCYDEKRCHLLYYRTANDANPLGSIDLCNAVFDCKMEAEEGTFEIKTPSRVFLLKAVHKEAMMYWLQQLQLRRREFSSGQITRMVAPVLPVTEYEQRMPGDDTAEEFLPPVKTPTEAVGLTVSFLPVPQQSTALQNISLKHPWTEIQNTVLNIRGSKPLRENVKQFFRFEDAQQNTTRQTEEQNIQAANEIPVWDHRQEDVAKPYVQKLSPSFNRARKGIRLNGAMNPFLEAISQERIPQDKTTSLQQQVSSLTEELKSQRELVKLLHRALESAQQEKRACSAYLTAPDEQDRLELVRHKVRQIEDLTRRVTEMEQVKKVLAESNAQQERDIAELKEHVQMLMEKNSSKQQVILKLTEHVCQNESGFASDIGLNPSETLRQQYETIEHLKDDMEAYKTQNKFLNSEIHHITNIWTNIAEREKALQMKCAYLQAKNCQIESKYLIVLRQLQEMLPDLDADDREMVKSLVEDALQPDVREGTESSFVQMDVVGKYDEYGFLTIPEYNFEHQKLLAKIQALGIKSNNLLNHEIVEKPLHMRWNNIGELAPSVELKNLIRMGIPVEYRQDVWKWIVSRRVPMSQNSSHYENLLKKCEDKENPASRQIELDLHRTLTNNRHFSVPTSQYIQKLRRVLLAFSWHNPTIGYCQGLNRLAALILLVMQEEESSFWCLVDIVENIMPVEYYSKTLAASQVDQRVFKDFLAEKLPKLTAHFEQHKIDLSLITFNWFLVVFVDSLVSDILLRVWDAFLYEGTKVIFRYALAIFKYNEEEILKKHESTEIYQYLASFTQTICDGRKLTNIAFNEMNPFRMKQLRNRRAAHMEKLKAELSELERIKEEYVKEKVEHANMHLDVGVSEDEEET
ncbi:TBC1 domain family member 2A isoform X2 [Lissotriton helveticus]